VPFGILFRKVADCEASPVHDGVGFGDVKVGRLKTFERRLCEDVLLGKCGIVVRSFGQLKRCAPRHFHQNQRLLTITFLNILYIFTYFYN
jgi:hypothetical protein